MVKNETTVTETISCPKGAMLDAWSDLEWKDGVQIDQIEELTTLAVQTSNSLYEITVLTLKRRGIYVGLRMEIVSQPVELVSRVEHDPTTGEKEILLGHKVIKTSPIHSIGIVV